jgi:RNA polymerase sigma factor (sigma-70 family)
MSGSGTDRRNRSGAVGREARRELPPRGKMAGLTATGPLERLAGERAALVAWLAARFRGRLSFEDCEDVVADALPRLAEDPRLPADLARAGAYARRALWRDALDELRHRHGRELARRAPLPLELAAELPQSDAETEGELAARQEREQLQAAAARMLARLSPSEAKVLRLRFLDEVTPDAIADELGVTRSQYQRRLSTASRHALDALVDAHSGPACPQVRRLITESPIGLLGRDDAGRRDAHLDECVHCRAFSLRARGALELLPLPAAGLLERFSARVSQLLGRGGESLVGLRDGHEVATAGGVGIAGAGTALGAGVGTKLAITCTGAAVAVVCAGSLTVVRPKAERTPAKRGTVKHQRSAKVQPPRRVAAATTSAPTVVAASTRPAAQTARTQRSGSTRRSGSRRETAAQEFGPESSVPSTSAPRASAASPGGEFSPPPPPPPVAKPPPSQPTASSFAREFAP